MNVVIDYDGGVPDGDRPLGIDVEPPDVPPLPEEGPAPAPVLVPAPVPVPAPAPTLAVPPLPLPVGLTELPPAPPAGEPEASGSEPPQAKADAEATERISTRRRDIEHLLVGTASECSRDVM